MMSGPIEVVISEELQKEFIMVDYRRRGRIELMIMLKF